MSWESKRLKYLCVDAGQYGMNISSDEYSADGRRLIRTSDIDDDGFLRSRVGGVFIDGNIESRYLLRMGDLLLSRSGTIGRSMVMRDLSDEPTFAGYLIRFRPGVDVDPRYLGYAVEARPFQARVESDAVATTIQNFNAERYANLPLEVPGIDEQRRISDYLDLETGVIRRLRSAHGRTIELGEERVESSIRELMMASGFLASNNMSQSTPLRRILDKVVRPTLRTAEVVTAFRDGQVTARSLRRIEGFTESSSSDPQGQAVHVGDVVVHGLDGFAGAIGDAEAEGNSSPVYHVCQVRGDGDSAFWGRLLRILALDGYLAMYGSSARERAVDFRNWERFGSTPLPVVEERHQREVGDAIRGLRPVRSRVAQIYSLLSERRQALITAAVTGQIDVSTARGVEV